jgi:hypothetical protein
MKLTRVVEYGILFETGTPVRFTFVRNTESSPYFGSTYQQDIEPTGIYAIHNPAPGDLPRGWVRGQMFFDNPLVIAFNERDNMTYDKYSWKVALVRTFKTAGRKLSRALLEEGYDGVVTTFGDYETREIVALRA